MADDVTTTHCLFAVSGPQKGALYSLSQGTYLIGRAPDQADIVQTGRGISRTHARVEVGPNHIQVADLNSTNGLVVNGEKVEQCTLNPGDTVSLGSESSLRMSLLDPAVEDSMNELYQSASTDALTGVLDRRGFEEQAAAEDSGCIALVDLDNYKELQQRYGSDGSDELLKKVALQLRLGLAKDGFVGRHCSDEFILLARRATRATAILLDGIRLGVASSRFRLSGSEDLVEVTFSSGVAPFQGDLEAALREAGGALQQAKKSGNNRLAIAVSRKD